MADSAPDGPDRGAVEPGRAGARGPGERGTLVIHDRVVETIATTAACEVDGVRRSGGTLDGVVGRRFPKVEARTAGTRTRVSVEVAVQWPVPLAQVLAQVRDHVRSRVQGLTGLDVDAVDVLAARVLTDRPTDQRRRVS